MEEILTPIAHCSKCDTPLPEHQVFCASCGYPERGTDAQKSKFQGQKVLKEREKREAGKKIKSARNTLFIVAAFTFLIGVYYYFQLDRNSGVLITNTILAIVYLLLGFWSQKKPLVSLILGLLVYLTVIVLMGILEPLSIAKGFIFKIIILIYMGKGINSALELKKQAS